MTPLSQHPAVQAAREAARFAVVRATEADHDSTVPTPDVDALLIAADEAFSAYEAALLTTHRRQVLTEIEEKLRAHAKSMPSNITVHRRQRAGVVESADFVASLRDTKENV